MPVTEGAVLADKYTLEHELGRGGMGTVWLAQNTSLGSEVAIKVLHATHDDADARARFEQEARGVAKLDSPHIVRVFDYGTTDDGEPFLVMERLAGTTLHERIDARGQLPLDEVVLIVRQICRALSHAHERGIVHRDLKPANIFIVDVDDEPFVKVLDFGVAKHVGPSDLGLTETGMLMGTPYYMSPEQLVNPSDVDHRTDLWSAAVIAYAIISGTLPFVGETVGALSLAVHTRDYAPPSSLRSGLPVAMDAFFERALEPSPEDRHASARELADALAQAASGEQKTEPIKDTANAVKRRVSPVDARVTDDPAVLGPRENGAMTERAPRPTWLFALAVLAVAGVAFLFMAQRDDVHATPSTTSQATLAATAPASSSARTPPTRAASAGTAPSATSTGSATATPVSLRPTLRRPTTTPSAAASAPADRPKAREKW